MPGQDFVTASDPADGRRLLESFRAEQADKAAALLRALANPVRLMVLCALMDSELSVGQLNERIPLSQSALSQHLARLRAEMLVATRRESQTIHYRIADPVVHEIIETLYGRYCAR